MPNLASVLKAEVARLARKELRQSSEALRKATTVHRAEIAALKRRITELEKRVKAFDRQFSRSSKSAVDRAAHSEAVDTSALRFRSAGMASNRQRLGLSAEDFGRLVGASGQSVYLWETGKAKPRPKSLAAIAALRGIGKKEAAEWLAAMKASG